MPKSDPTNTICPSRPVCGTPKHRCVADRFSSATAARNNVSAFISRCLTDPRGNPIVQALAHEELQSHLTKHRHALIEFPRDHGKSFQVCGRVLWELGRNPALRIKIVCATTAVAAERSRFLREAIANNRAVREVFPELKPDQPWAAGAFTLERPGNAIGPSVAAFGVGSGSTGTRADLLICDDVVDVRSLRSKSERDRVADFFNNNLMNLLEPEGRFWGLFTPWHLDDLNARLNRAKVYPLVQRAVTSDLESVWPVKWSTETLHTRKEEVGTSSFARGYRLVPLADEETPIRKEWVKYWTEPAECEQVILSVDPAVSAATKADRSALVVLGRTASAVRKLEIQSPKFETKTDEARQSILSHGADRGFPSDFEFRNSYFLEVQVRVLAAVARRVAAPELVNLIDEFDKQWNPAVILFETNAAFRGIKDLLTIQTRFGAKLKGVTQTADKAARVAAFSVAVENGAFRLKGDDTQRELFEEMTTFPFGEHDDLLDAAATGCAYLLDRREPRVW